MKGKLICSMVMATAILLTGCEDTSENKNVAGDTKKQSIERKTNEKTDTTENKKNTDLLKTLNEAKEVVIKKAYYSFGAEYSLYVEDELVGRVKGNPIKIKGIGDVFRMEDLNGTVVKQESEVPKWGRLSRLAVISTPDGTTTGYIGEEYWEDLLEYGYKFHIYDKDKKEIGYTKQNLTLVKKEFEVFDMEGNEDYDIEKEMFELTSTYRMKVKDNSNMSVEDIVFFVTIQDAIMSSVNDTDNVNKAIKTAKKITNVSNGSNLVLNNASGMKNTSSNVNNEKVKKSSDDSSSKKVMEKSNVSVNTKDSSVIKKTSSKANVTQKKQSSNTSITKKNTKNKSASSTTKKSSSSSSKSKK